MSDKMIDVRGVIDRSARVATLKELADQGKKKVKVVNTSQIAQMISEAVDNVVARKAITLAEKERAQLVKESNEEFRRITAERDSDRQNQSKLEHQLEETRRELEKARAERDSGGAFREKAAALEEKVRELTRKSDEDRRTVEALRKDAEAAKRDVAAAREESERSRRELERLRPFETEAASLRHYKTSGEESAKSAEKRVAELQRVHEEDVRTAAAQKQEIRALEKRVEELTKELAEARKRHESTLASAEKQGGAVASLQADLKALIRSQGESQELVKSQALQLRDYESKIAAMTEEMTKARSNSVPAEAMAALVSQFAELKSSLDKKAADNAAAAGAMGSIEQLIASKMDAIQSNIARKVENITFKPQEAEAVATEVVLDRIFDHRQELESNLGTVEVKEAKEGGIGDSLKRLKNMQKPG